MNRRRVAADGARRCRPPRAAWIRTAWRLAVILLLLAGAVTRGRPAGAAFLPSFFIQVDPIETTLGQFTSMDITATGTDLGEHLTVTLQGTAVAGGTTGSTPGSGDTLALPGVTVPSGVAACGTDTVNLIFSGATVATTTVRVYCPTIQVTPDPVDSGGGLAQFTVTAIGFPQNRDVTLVLDGESSPFTDVATDGNGAFVKPASRPQLPCGDHLLVGIAGSGQPVIQSVRRSAVEPYPTLPASTTFAVAGCARPQLTANPAVFVDGTYTHVTGTGFAPAEPIALTWQTTTGATLTACSPTADPPPALVADANGDIDTFCFAPEHQILGAAQIAATQTIAQNGAQATRRAAAPVVIEGGSMQPSTGSELIFRR